ncbi:MAG: biopolymer transporter ExbD [Oligoflexales bacterium]|nr:biopolymer transporter ExbD [Oligoflexales bacterium]
MRKKSKPKVSNASAGVELNIMPFIDIFSLLCTFLLFSAVFLSMGIHVVQIPFLSNAAAPSSEKERTLSIKVHVEKDSILLSSEWSEEPLEKNDQTFPRNADGITRLHEALVGLRVVNKTIDKLDLFADDELTYADLVDVLDAIKLRQKNDPVFEVFDKKTNTQIRDEVGLFPKVVMGSVIL